MSGSLGYVDYTIIGLVQLICILIGVYHGRQKKTSQTVESYALGNRSLSPLAAGLSLMATYVNAFAMVSHVSEMVAFGLIYGTWNVCLSIGPLFAAYAIVPVFHRSSYISIYEILERKYGSSFRQLFTLFYFILQLIYGGIFLFVPSITLSTITDIPYWVSTTALGLICVAYSTTGGIKAVIFTDVFQAILMISSMLLITVNGVIENGGLANVLLITREKQFARFNFVGNHTDKYTFLPLFLNGVISSLLQGSVSQHVLQRILAVKNLNEAKKASWIAFFCLCLFHLSLLTTAIVVFAYFNQCDGDLGKPKEILHNNEQAVPLYIVKVLTKYPGFAGIAISGIFSGSLSTMSSTINSCSVVMINDFLQRYVSTETYKKYSVLFCKIGTVWFGLMSIIFALCMPLMGGIMRTFQIVLGGIYGPLGACFFLVMFKRSLNNRAVLCSLILSMAFVAWIAFGSISVTKNVNYTKPSDIDICHTNTTSFIPYETFNHTLDYDVNIENESSEAEPGVMFLYRLSPAWYLFIGFTLCCILSITFSSPFNNPKTPKELLSPWILKAEHKFSPIKTKDADEKEIELVCNSDC